MKIDLTKQDLIKLCRNLTSPRGEGKYSEFCGNQLNEGWCWKKGVFEEMSEEQLWKFYTDYTGIYEADKSRKVRDKNR